VLARWLLGTYLLQLGVGTLNLALLAPIVLQLIHLGLAVLAFACWPRSRSCSSPPLRPPPSASDAPVGACLT
jgi:heme A synthase